ncbi:glutathione S-transferase C-terminal domain-containing protein [Actinomycetaceae bacterium L2_0104]
MTSTLTAQLEADAKTRPEAVDRTTYPEMTVEQTDDGGFRRQRNWFSTRFGEGRGEARPEPGRYLLLASPSCGWGRRQLITLRLLGLDEAVPFVLLTGRDEQGWRIAPTGNSLEEDFGSNLLNTYYRRSDVSFQGRGTSPTVIDSTTGFVVSNNYHLLPYDWEVAWKQFHAPDAPDLYPEHLRKEIDLLNQQIFDDVNNGTYKVLFATGRGAADVAKGIFEARLADLDHRLSTRRYLFGEKITDSDIRLFVTLSSYERSYRPGIAAIYGEENVKHLQDFPNLWDYARDLFAQGFVDDRELYYLGLLPGPSGDYVDRSFAAGSENLLSPEDDLARWRVPSGREHLTGSPYYSGPGGGGSYERWTFA